MTLRTASLIGLLAACCAPVWCAAQNKPLFPGAEALDSCLVELPLTYAKKDKERYTQAARFLENEELIYLTYDKKTNTATYSRVYVVVDASKDGAEFVYVESAEDHMRMEGAKQAIFPRYIANKQRFYNAACFDLRAHDPALNDRLKEVKLGAP